MTNRQVIQLMYGKDKTGFGFKGTMERLRYYYKEDDVFEVQSTEGEFCEVELKLPLKGGKIDVSGNDN